MKILVNVFHPDLAASRLNAAWADALESRAGVTVRRLAALYPDRRIDVEAEQALLQAHDRIVFQHPMFWYSVPPLFKQWLDEVLTYGLAYGAGGTQLHGREWLSVVSTGAPADAYQAGGSTGYTVSELLKPLQATAGLIGMTFLPPFVEHGAGAASVQQVADSARRLLRHVESPELDPARQRRRMLEAMAREQQQAMAAALPG